jgi:hypothetical protein
VGTGGGGGWKGSGKRGGGGSGERKESGEEACRHSEAGLGERRRANIVRLGPGYACSGMLKRAASRGESEGGAVKGRREDQNWSGGGEGRLRRGGGLRGGRSRATNTMWVPGRWGQQPMPSVERDSSRTQGSHASSTPPQHASPRHQPPPPHSFCRPAAIRHVRLQSPARRDCARAFSPRDGRRFR